LDNHWYKTWFSNKFYLQLYKHRDTEDARNLINLIQRTVKLPADSKALDICCGAGRHSIELAKRGFNVTGFDLSAFLISEAKKELKRLKEKNLNVKFLIKDMRNFDFKNSFHIAVNLFTSFGYFDNDSENFLIFENVSSSLRKNGFFVFDFLNGIYLKKNLIKSSKGKIGDNTVIQKRRIENNFVIKDIIIKSGLNEYRHSERLKLYELKELQIAFGNNRLRIENVFGDYFGNKYDLNKSARLIIFAKKI
jgi:SAM-dependent methyltransferase